MRGRGHGKKGGKRTCKKGVNRTWQEMVGRRHGKNCRDEGMAKMARREHSNKMAGIGQNKKWHEESMTKIGGKRTNLSGCTLYITVYLEGDL